MSCFFFQCYGHHRDLHSFPTRRSSDLELAAFAHENACVSPSDDAADSGPAPARTIKDAYPNFLVRAGARSEEHTSELQSRRDLVCRLLLEKKKNKLYKNI